MSAATDSSVTNGHGGDEERPQIEALFLIQFDKKVGYTVAWKRTTTDIELDNAVEFKSLPSGLHTVQSDLVYFTHEGYAGISAFAKGDASAQARHANFVAVGILAKREGEYGRLGRGWLLAGRLEELAASMAKDSEHMKPLEDFWQEQTAPANTKGDAQNGSKCKGHGRRRAMSTVSAVSKEDERLPEYHPALSILQYMDVFGPLVFRLQQAALLRKRILFVGMPPVRRMCEFVYNLSVLSSISPRDSELLGPGTESLLRLPTHFSIGVHDIPWLESHKHSTQTAGGDAAEGWAACTTDEIITTKPQLYDIVVELPQVYDAPPEQRRWPRIRTNDGSLVKASQRDVARYKLLHKELFKHRNRSPPNAEAYHDDEDDDDDNDTAPLISQSEIDAKRADDEYNESYDDTVVEPVTWSRLAYLGFMWWASAGEKDAYVTAERDGDGDLIAGLAEYERSVETGVIAYFHRQTSTLVRGLSQLIESKEDDEGQERSRPVGETTTTENVDDDEGDILLIDRTDLSRLGLDTWSEADRAFVNEFGQMYFGQRVDVRGNEVDCCGLRVPIF